MNLFKVILVSVALLVSSLVYGQDNISIRSLAFGPSFTASTLPTASTNSGRIFKITDGLTGMDCTVGGGTFTTLCQSSGSAYLPAMSGLVGADSSGNIAIAGSITTGGTSYVCGTASPVFCGTESTNVFTPAAGVDAQQANSTNHCWLESDNGSTGECHFMVNGSLTAGHAVKVNSQLGSGGAYDLADAGAGCFPGSFTAQTDGSTVTWAIASAACANASLTFTVHSGSRTLNLTGLVAGGSYVIKLIQDGTGGENLTGGTGCTWKQPGGGGSTFTLTGTAAAIDTIAFMYDGTNCLAVLAKAYS